MASSDPPSAEASASSAAAPTPGKAVSGGAQLPHAATAPSETGVGSSSARNSTPGPSSTPASTSPSRADAAAQGVATTYERAMFEASLRRLVAQQQRHLPPPLPPSSSRQRSSSMPDVASTGLKASIPRACYSASASGACSPIEYESPPPGVRTPGREPHAIKSTLSYLDLAGPRRDGRSELPESTSSTVTKLARTWAHDLSADARRNRTLAGVSAASSGSATSGSSAACCTPAKVAIVVQLELLTDRPLRLHPVSMRRFDRRREPGSRRPSGGRGVRACRRPQAEPGGATAAEPAPVRRYHADRYRRGSRVPAQITCL
ncbi:uncharacterized protein [Dermacentor andersoni]|uniref:uncharacterized protein isoform X2 n=1 Tax=Dermacentor andersoni TaxID=34620 RepID=UPI00241621EB|nr:uncharacterized protein LOC126525718 isoform X2 [Dermacentor andersoni]